MGLLAVTVFDSFFCPPNAMSCRVMMVDDNDNDLLFTRLMLQRSGVDYEVLAYERAEQALRYLSDTPHHGVSLILLDINMPVMNGEEMLRRVRANPETENLPVIVVSTEGSEARLQVLTDLGASIVRKPFAPETLRDTILRVTGVTDVEYYGPVPVAGDDGDF